MKNSILLLMLVSSVVLPAQKTTLQAHIVKAREEFWVKAQMITDISTDTSFIAASDLKLATQLAIKKYCDSRIGGDPFSNANKLNGYRIGWDGSKWAPVPNTATVADGDKGDLTVSSAGSIFTVDGLQGRALSATAPTISQVLKWNGTAWAPGIDDNTGTTYTPGTGISIVGTTISNTGDLSTTNEIQRLDTLSIVGGVLRASLLNDGVPASTVTLPVADGSETKVNAGAGVAVTGAGTTASPYMVANNGDLSTTNEIQRLDTLSIVGGVLRASLLNDGVPASTVTLPVADGSETKVNAGAGVAVTGAGTTASPYVVANTGVLGSGTSGYLSRFSAANTLTNSVAFQFGDSLAIGATSGRGRLHVRGAGNTSAQYTAQFHNATGASNSLLVRNDAIVSMGTPYAGGRLNIGYLGGTVTEKVIDIYESAWGEYWVGRYADLSSRGLTIGGTGVGGTPNNDVFVVRTFPTPKASFHRPSSSFGYLLEVGECTDFDGLVVTRTIPNDTSRMMLHVNVEGDGIMRSKSGNWTFGDLDIGAADQNPEARLHLFTPGGQGTASLLRLERTGSWGYTNFEQFATASSRGLHIGGPNYGNVYQRILTISNTGRFVGINNENPLTALDITGSLRVSAIGGTATSIAGKDGSNIFTNIATGAGLSLSGGTLSNTGDTNSADDLTTSTVAAGDVSGVFSNLQIAAGAVATADIADAATTTAKIADGNITLAKMAVGSVNSATIVNGTIDALDFAPQGASTGQPLVYSGAGYTPQSSGGDVSGPYTNLQMVANSVTNVEIADNAVGGSEIASGAVAPAELFFASYSAGSTIYSDGSQWLYGQRLVDGYSDNNLGGGTGSVTLSSSRVDNLLRGSNWTSLTINMPASPADGRVCELTSDVTASSVTWSGNGNTLVGTLPSALSVGDTFKFKFYAANSKWVRITY